LNKNKIVKIILITIASIIVLFIIFLYIFLYFIFGGIPASAYHEVERVGISIDEKYISVLANTISRKTGDSSLIKYIAVFQYSPTTQSEKSELMLDIRTIYNNFNNDEYPLVFFTELDHTYYGEPRTGHDIKELYYSNSLMYKDKSFLSIKIEFEREEDKYIIKKIGDYQYYDDNWNSKLVKGTGYFEEGAEYLIIFFLPRNNHYTPPPIPPVKFVILNGVPIIQVNEYKKGK
jgi:hypothetical protein